MFRTSNFFLLLIFFSIPLSAKDNSIILEREGNELIIHYTISKAKEIREDEHYKNLLVKDKTFTKSEEGKFKVTLNIKPEVSKDFYDPIRVYSNGDFLLYKDFLFPERIRYDKSVFLDKKKDDFPKFSIEERKNYIIGDRFVFWGDKEPIKILGLEKNQALKDNILQVYKRIFNYYSDNFGALFKRKPIVIIDFTEDGGEFDYKGDALDNFLSCNISNLSKLDKKKYYNMYMFISHEIFHIWNSYEHNHRGKAWLHEGSAEYFSMMSLLDLNYIEKNKVESLKKIYLDTCLDYYKKNNTIMNNNNSENSVYMCGASLHILLEKLESREIVLDIWKELLKKDKYNSDDFFEIINNHSAISKGRASSIYDFIYKEGGVVQAIEGLKLK